MEKSLDLKCRDTGLDYYILLFMIYVETELRVAAYKENGISSIWNSESAPFELKGGILLLITYT